MKTPNNSLIVGIRAAVGALLVAIAATAVVLLGTVPLPVVERVPLAITEDTTQDVARTLVCDGGFAELGADPSNPELAVSAGAPVTALAGAATEPTQLQRPAGGEGLPTVFTGEGVAPLGAAQLQQVETQNLRGAVASSCAEPLNEQWLIGGGTGLGLTTTLNIGNPGSVPATVQVSLFDELGPVEAVRTAGIIVAPGTQQTVSLNGYAPDREQLAVHVSSSGAPVTAALSVGHQIGLKSFGVSTVDRQAAPATTLVIPAIANAAGGESGPSDAGEGDSYPVMVRVLAPGGEQTTVRLRALDANGHATQLGEIELAGQAVGALNIMTWPKGAAALEVSADVPVIAAALGSAEKGDEHDYEWFTPAEAVAAEQPLPLPVVAGGTVVVVHPGEGEAEATIVDPEGESKLVKLAPGATVELKVANGSTLTATDEVFVGVRYLSAANIASYPVQPPSQRDGRLTVYTR